MNLSLNALVLLLAGAAQAQHPDHLQADYRRHEVGDYGLKQAQTDWRQVDWWQNNRARIVDNAACGRCLEVLFPQDRFSAGGTGLNFTTPLAPRDGYELSFRVQFQPGFQFQRPGVRYGGGKLLGLAGGSRPSGGAGKDDGMSLRIMWRGDAKFEKQRNYIEAYLYWRHQDDKYGDRFFLSDVEPGRFYSVRMQVSAGTAERDGFARIWVDDQLRYDRPHRFVAAGHAWAMNQLMHHGFYGGNDPTWAPDADTSLLLDGVQVRALPTP
jgi:hypothetical protein